LTCESVAEIVSQNGEPRDSPDQTEGYSPPRGTAPKNKKSSMLDLRE
jgi:hypothetical protein